MARIRKRTRLTSQEGSGTQLTCREYHYEKRGKHYVGYLVQGWTENGKAKRKQFANEEDAKTFIALKRIEIENQGADLRMVTTSLSDKQKQEAEDAFSKLGDTYSLTEAIDFFLKNHRPPEFTISLDKALGIYLDEREADGIRERSLKAKKSVLEQFTREVENIEVHEVTAQSVNQYLRGLRAKDGVNPATRKTWNNYRNELNHFFDWCAQTDLATNRPFTFRNVVQDVRHYTAKQVAEQRQEIITTSVSDVLERMTNAFEFRGGALAKYYALAYFAGIRPDGELQGLSKQEQKLINLKTQTIIIPASLSKTGEKRTVSISDNLKQWLEALKHSPIVPTNFNRLNKEFRKLHGFTHDETRHTFISYHVALNRSVGDVALQAGNSESIVKKHYLNLYPIEEGQDFFSIVPDLGNRTASIIRIGTQKTESHHLKAI